MSYVDRLAAQNKNKIVDELDGVGELSNTTSTSPLDLLIRTKEVQS